VPDWLLSILEVGFGIGVGTASFFVAAVNYMMIHQTRKRMVPAKKLPGTANVALVLGARVWPSGRPSLMLEDRLATALDLYRTGKAKSLIVSGDDSPHSHREVAIMAEWLVQNGIPREDIILDPQGVRTAESILFCCHRGYNNPVIVTQRFHLVRALWLAQALGLNAWGVAADRRRYRWGSYMRVVIREIFARVLAYAEARSLRQRFFSQMRNSR
jgi:SanA protein